MFVQALVLSLCKDRHRAISKDKSPLCIQLVLQKHININCTSVLPGAGFMKSINSYLLKDK